MTKERILWLDNLKAILIIIVVFGHCIQHTFTDYSNMVSFRYIYSFHMALFMFVSGYACYRGTINWGIITRRSKQLLLPFLAWSLFLTIIKGVSFGNMILHPGQSFWFLWVLFFITIIHVFACEFAKHFKIPDEYVSLLLALSLLSLKFITKTSIFDINLITYHFVFYIAGFYFHKYDFFDRISKKESILLLAVWLFAGWFWDMGKPIHQSSFYSAPLTMGIHYFIAGIAILAFSSLSSLYLRDRIKCLTQIGGGTLTIYIIHLVLLDFIPKDWSLLFRGYEWLYVIILTVILTIVSYFVHVLLSKNRFTTVLIGK